MMREEHEKCLRRDISNLFGKGKAAFYKMRDTIFGKQRAKA